MTLREDAAVYIGVILREPLATAGMNADADGQPLTDLDVSGALKEPLDTTDRAMGFVTIPEMETAAREAAYYALAEVFTLRRVKQNVAPRFNVGISGDSYALSQSRAGINDLLADAEIRALFLAGPTAVNGGAGADAATGGAGIGAIDLDWSGGPAWDEEYAR